MSDPWEAFPAVEDKHAASPWDAYPAVDDKPKAGVAEDVAKSGASGAARGWIGLAGLPGTLAKGLRYGADFAADQTIGRAVNYANTGSFEAPNLPSTPEMMRQQGINAGPVPDETISGENLTNQAAKLVPGINYKPQTEAGKVASTVGEFTPGLLSPGSMAQRVIGGVVVPALASEGLGRVGGAISPSLEAPGRIIGGVAGGVTGALMSRPSSGEAAISAGMRGVDDAKITAAGQLMLAAQARGVELTWPEAVAQATNGGGKGLTNLQRVVEGSQGGGDTMGAFMAQRPAQIERAGREAFDTIAPQSQAPSTIGPTIGQAAGERIADVRGAINSATEPLYTAASTVRVPPQEFARIQALPGYAEAAQAIQSTPQLKRYVQGLPEDSVGFLNEVKKFLGTASDNAAGPMNANKNMQVAAGYGLDENVVRKAATDASPQYAQALAVQEQARKQFLDPLLQGPIGKLAEKDITTKQAIGVLFPPNPLPGSAPEIVDAVSALAKKNPMAARQLVRAHVESTFNDAAQQLQAGANQFGGAGFAAALRGNKQQAENLAAAIQGVAGPQVLQGFDEFLNVLSATGQRQRIGSQTAFNQEAQDVLKRGGAIGEAANAVATAGIKLPGRIKEAYEQWRLGQNTQQIANLFTDPNAIGMFRRLAQAAPGSNQAQAIAARIATMATSAQIANRPVP